LEKKQSWSTSSSLSVCFSLPDCLSVCLSVCLSLSLSFSHGLAPALVFKNLATHLARVSSRAPGLLPGQYYDTPTDTHGRRQYRFGTALVAIDGQSTCGTDHTPKEQRGHKAPNNNVWLMARRSEPAFTGDYEMRQGLPYKPGGHAQCPSTTATSK